MSHSKTVWIDPGCPPQIVEMILNRKADDEKIVAERQWRASLKPRKPQRPIDIGLFSDEADQLDLCEMFQEPVED
jgi:hypothetical protein